MPVLAGGPPMPVRPTFGHGRVRMASPLRAAATARLFRRRTPADARRRAERVHSAGIAPGRLRTSPGAASDGDRVRANPVGADDPARAQRADPVIQRSGAVDDRGAHHVGGGHTRGASRAPQCVSAAPRPAWRDVRRAGARNPQPPRVTQRARAAFGRKGVRPRPCPRASIGWCRKRFGWKASRTTCSTSPARAEFRVVAANPADVLASAVAATTPGRIQMSTAGAPAIWPH